jgi:hypothetical protein
MNSVASSGIAKASKAWPMVARTAMITSTIQPSLKAVLEAASGLVVMESSYCLAGATSDERPRAPEKNDGREMSKAPLAARIRAPPTMPRYSCPGTRHAGCAGKHADGQQPYVRPGPTLPGPKGKRPHGHRKGQQLG